MPIQSCTLSGGGKGYKWGTHGHCYSSRQDALKQMRAIFHSGYTGAEEELDSLMETLADSKVISLNFDKTKFNRVEAQKWASEHGFSNEFVRITEDKVCLNQAYARTNAETSTLELGEGITVVLEGELTTQMYVESKSFNKKQAKIQEKLAKKTDRGPEDSEAPPSTMGKQLTVKDATKVATTTNRMEDTAKPQTSVPMEVNFLFDKRRFSKDGAAEWYRHYMKSVYGMSEEDQKVDLVDGGEFWVYKCLTSKDFSKTKTVLYHEGVTVQLGIP